MLSRLLIATVGLFGFASASISDCGNGASVFQFTDLNLEPASPTPGENAVMTVKFNNPGPEVTDGTVNTAISLNYIPLSPTTEALCTNTQCPLVNGANDRSTSSAWPDVTGLVQSTIKWTGVDGSLLLCIKLSVNTKEVSDNSTISVPRLRGSQ